MSRSTPGTKIKLTVKTRAVSLLKLNTTAKEIECDVDWTWQHFFGEVCKVPVDPSKYVVKRIGGTNIGIRQKVRDLMSEFKTVKKFYRVDVVEGKPESVQRPTARANSYAATNSGANNARGRPAGNGLKRGRTAVPNDASPPPERKSRGVSRESVSSASTTPVIRGPSTSQQKARGSNNKQPVVGSGAGQQNPPRRLIEEITLGPNHSSFKYVDEEDDDNASQFTTSSQDSQDELLEEHNIIKEDLKPRVASRLLNNVSNAQLLLVRKELKTILDTNMWLRYASRAPMTSHLVNELILNA